MKRKKKPAKESTAKLPRFRDLLPNLKGIGNVWVSDLLVTMIVETVLSAKTQKKGPDRKSIENSIDLELGSGIMPRIFREVCALTTQVSEWVEDGNERAKLVEYVKGRLVYAAYKHGSTDRHLLERVAAYLKDDLLDCKTSTVFDRRR